MTINPMQSAHNAPRCTAAPIARTQQDKIFQLLGGWPQMLLVLKAD